MIFSGVICFSNSNILSVWDKFLYSHVSNLYSHLSLSRLIFVSVIELRSQLSSK